MNMYALYHSINEIWKRRGQSELCIIVNVYQKIGSVPMDLIRLHEISREKDM